MVGPEGWEKAYVIGRWLDSEGDDIGPPYPDMTVGDGVGTWDWKRSVGVFTVPAGAAQYRALFGIMSRGMGTLYLDAVQIEYGVAAKPFTT